MAGLLDANLTAVPGSRAPAREGSPHLRARIAGALWLFVTVAGVFAELYVPAKLIVRADAAATAARIVASETLFRLGFVADLAAGAAYLAVVILLYDLMLPAGRSVSRLALGFGVVGSAVAAVSVCIGAAPVLMLDPARPLVGFSAAEVQSLAYLFIRLSGYAEDFALVLFSGVYLSLLGWLVLRSSFLPRFVGALLVLAGGCYLLDTMSLFLAPAFEARLAAFINLPCFVGEASMALWLLFRGVDGARWVEQARAADAAA